MATAATTVTNAGIPLILVNRNVSNDDYTCAITGSNYQIGQKTWPNASAAKAKSP